jgi:4-amino-4-deoxy-L-arabinose transferase-like glycosyltransferase
VVRRLPLTALLLAVATAIVIRLPLLGVPLDADEGGYAYLARRWAGGGRLYGSVWVDRPQALMLSYRFVTGLGSAPALIRLAAIALAVILLLGVAAAAGALAGRSAGLIAAFLVAVVGAAPHLQGFMFNGELAAGAFSAWAVACALLSRNRGDRWLLLAGACGAVAVLMKQSGFDGLVTALVIALVLDRIRAAALVLAGAVLPIGLALLHAALTSWQDWWFAVVGYRLQTSAGSRGGISGRWHNLTAGLPHLWPDLVPLGLLGAAGLIWCIAQRNWLPVCWLATATAGFAGGVFFFPHYWMQLVGPLCLLGALALAAIPRRAAVALTVLACLPACWWTVGAVAMSRDHRDRLAVPDGRLLANRDISPWLRSHAAPGDQLYAFVSSADLYYSTGLHTDFRYLWQANLEAIPSAVGTLRGYLAGPDRPQWVVLYAQPAAIDPSGAIAATLATEYVRVTVIDGYPILHRR